MRNKNEISFVILHYQDFETTKNSVSTLLKTLGDQNYSIVIVDNGSPNGTGVSLKTEFANQNKVTVILSDKNQGFASGNNIGYRYAREVLGSSFVVVMNNDIFIRDPNFITKIKNQYAQTPYALLGPDVITREGVHQNPLRDTRFEISEIQRKIKIKKIFLVYYRAKKIFGVGDRIQVLEKLFEQKDKRNKKKWEEPIVNPVLMGACIVYSPIFLKSEKYAFSPRTFMYGEEDLLAEYCYRKNYTCLYTPALQVTHLHGQSTKSVSNSRNNRNIFMYENIIKGYDLLIKEKKHHS